MKLKVTRGGVEIQDTGVLASGEKVNIELIPVIPGTDQEIKDDTLPKGISWSIEYVVDGNTEKTEPGNKLTGVVLKSGDNMIRGTMQIPGFAPSVYEIYFDIEEIVYNFGIKVDQPDPLSYYRRDGKTSSEHGAVTFWITNDDVPLTKDELKALDLKLTVDSKTCDNSNVEGFLNLFGKLPADCSLTLNDDGSFTMIPISPITSSFVSFLIKAGDYTVNVSLNRDKSITATGKFTLLPSYKDWFDMLPLVFTVYLFFLLGHSLFFKKKFRGQEILYRRYELVNEDGEGREMKGHDSCKLHFALLFAPYNLLSWRKSCIYKFHDVILRAGSHGTVAVTGKSITGNKSIGSYCVSSYDPEESLGTVIDSLMDVEVIIDPEKKKTKRTAPDLYINGQQRVYFSARARGNDSNAQISKVWCLFQRQ